VSVAAFDVGRLNPKGWPDHAWDWFDWASFSYPFNFTGQPAATVPAGFTPSGMPVGLQIVGRPWADLTVLQASRAFEHARPWTAPAPGRPCDRPSTREVAGCSKGPDARRRPRAAREAYLPGLARASPDLRMRSPRLRLRLALRERAVEGANEADGPFSAACLA